MPSRTQFAVVFAIFAALGCTTSTEPAQLHGMRLAAKASIVREAGTSTTIVSATLSVTNEADSTQRIYWGECPSGGPLVLFAYRPGNQRPVWNATDAYANVYCFAIRKYADLAPGQTWVYNRTVPVGDILGDSLPVGTYSLKASAKWLEPGFPQELPMGDFELMR